jgi:hypothetical protein
MDDIEHQDDDREHRRTHPQSDAELGASHRKLMNALKPKDQKPAATVPKPKAIEEPPEEEEDDDVDETPTPSPLNERLRAAEERGDNLERDMTLTNMLREINPNLDTRTIQFLLPAFRVHCERLPDGWVYRDSEDGNFATVFSDLEELKVSIMLDLPAEFRSRRPESRHAQTVQDAAGAIRTSKAQAAMATVKATIERHGYSDKAGADLLAAKRTLKRQTQPRPNTTGTERQQDPDRVLNDEHADPDAKAAALLARNRNAKKGR